MKFTLGQSLPWQFSIAYCVGIACQGSFELACGSVGACWWAAAWNEAMRGGEQAKAVRHVNLGTAWCGFWTVVAMQDCFAISSFSSAVFDEIQDRILRNWVLGMAGPVIATSILVVASRSNRRTDWSLTSWRLCLLLLIDVSAVHAVAMIVVGWM